MEEYHECECLEPGCTCLNQTVCTPGSDWCDDCDEGIHQIPINRSDSVMDMTYAELEREPLFDDDFYGYEYEV